MAVWATNNNPLRQARAYHTATALRDGKILVVGGWNGSLYLNTAEIFEPTGVSSAGATGTATVMAHMPMGRGHHTALLLASGKVLVVGGTTGDASSPSVLVGAQFALLYDPSKDIWQAVKALNRARSGCTATVDALGWALVIGGNDPVSGEWVLTAETYDENADTWTETAPMSQSRQSPSATLLSDGRVLVAGGLGITSLRFLNTAELYDPVKNVWMATGPMTLARFQHAAVPLDDGQVFAVGGQSGTGGLVGATAELYNPATGVWTATGPMTQAKVELTTTTLLDGRVLVAGGRNAEIGGGGVDLAVAEIFDAKNGTWTATELMGEQRAAHTATRAGDGSVWVLGGATRHHNSFQALQSIEAGSFPITATATSTSDTPADTTKPTLLWVLLNGQQYPPGGRIEVDTVGSDHEGALVPYELVAYDPDNPTSALKVTSTPPPSAAPIPVGDTNVVCTISDPAGNTTTMNFTIRVNGIAPMIVALMSATNSALSRYYTLNLMALIAEMAMECNDALLAYIRGDVNIACQALSQYQQSYGKVQVIPGAIELWTLAQNIKQRLGCGS